MAPSALQLQNFPKQYFMSIISDNLPLKSSRFTPLYFHLGNLPNSGFYGIWSLYVGIRYKYGIYTYLGYWHTELANPTYKSASRETIPHPQLLCRKNKKRLCLQCKSYQYTQQVVLRISFSNSKFLSRGIKKDMLFVLGVMQVTWRAHLSMSLLWICQQPVSTGYGHANDISVIRNLVNPD